MTGRVVTFGEIMLRLKSPGVERLLQSPILEATFGGGEANVAVSLSNFGIDVAYVTVVPKNLIGDACLADLRRLGVDTSLSVRGGERLGTYYLEAGANQRPSVVVYDRTGSSIATATPGSINWARIFEGATWFHVTGITPAISQTAADLTLEAVRKAKEQGLCVSCDYNFRKNLWKYGKSAREVMSGIMPYVDVGIANEEDCQEALGVSVGGGHRLEGGRPVGSARCRALPGFVREGPGSVSLPEEAGHYAAGEPQRQSQRLVSSHAQPKGVSGECAL